MTGPARAKVGYLIHADDDAAMVALATCSATVIGPTSSTSRRRSAVRSSPRGRSCLRTSENADTLHEAVRRVALEHGLSVLATDTGLVDEGAGLGSFHVSWVKPPKVAMLVDRPASPLRRAYLVPLRPGLALSRSRAYRAPRLADLDLSKYNVLILPDGRYPGPLGEPFVARLKDWVRGGGTLILVKGAASWATEKSVGLLASKPVKKVVKTEPEPSPTRQEGSRKGRQAGRRDRAEGRRREARGVARPRARARSSAPRFMTTTLSRSALRRRSSR